MTGFRPNVINDLRARHMRRVQGLSWAEIGRRLAKEQGRQTAYKGNSVQAVVLKLEKAWEDKEN